MYMSETGTSFDTYIRLYKERWKDLMKNESITPLASYGNRSINTTWSISYDAIRAKNKSAANHLLLWAHLSNKLLPYWILQAGSNGSAALAKELSALLADAAGDEVTFLNSIRLLQNYCMVESLQGGFTCNTHPVVHQWAFHIQNDGQRAELSRLAVLILGHAVPDKDTAEFHPKQRQLLPHAESWMERMNKITADLETGTDKPILYALHQLGSLFYNQRKLVEAEKMYQRALLGKEKAWGPNHTSTLNTVNNLGILYADQGKLAEAEKMYQRSLEGYNAALGPDLVLTYVPALHAAYGFASLFEKQDRFGEAKSMYARALKGYEQVFGVDHQWFLAAQERLAYVESKLGDLDSLRPLSSALDVLNPAESIPHRCRRRRKR